jgi:hypothetical protein
MATKKNKFPPGMIQKEKNINNLQSSSPVEGFS